MWAWLTTASPVEWLVAISAGIFSIAKLLVAAGEALGRWKERAAATSVSSTASPEPVSMDTVRALHSLIETKACSADVLDEAAVLKLLERDRHQLREEFTGALRGLVMQEVYRRDREEVFRRLGALEQRPHGMGGLAGVG